MTTAERAVNAINERTPVALSLVLAAAGLVFGAGWFGATVKWQLSDHERRIVDTEATTARLVAMLEANSVQDPVRRQP